MPKKIQGTMKLLSTPRPILSFVREPEDSVSTSAGNGHRVFGKQSSRISADSRVVDCFANDAGLIR